MKRQLLSKTVIPLLLAGSGFCWNAAADGGADLWKSMHCTACHGQDGKGNTMMGHRLSIKDLTDPKVQSSFTDADATKDIKDGITEDGKKKMNAFGDKLTDEQITNLVSYVRSLKK